ncbi:MAG: peptidylprolyl isomerase [Chloroflexi bacterium RBG_16_58_8]|nr:MAG: peptidylprolyl isomerase [Chloroflexi bacterium RBG_16_58_8]
MRWDSPPKMTIDTGKKYTATIETAKGNLVLELFAKDVPKTVNNFVFLARAGYYDGSTFHRVIPGFMAQGGDPTGTGMGNPGYTFADEFTSHTNVTGALSMANAGPNTNGSQFFISYSPQHGLDGRHTVFGQLTRGTDVLLNLTPRDPSQNPQFPGDKVIKVTIKEE